MLENGKKLYGFGPALRSNLENRTMHKHGRLYTEKYRKENRTGNGVNSIKHTS